MKPKTCVMKKISTFFISILLLSGFYASRAEEVSPPVLDPSDELCDTEECYVSGYGESERAIWLPALPGGIHEDFEFGEGGGHFETFPDGTAHLYGTVLSIENSAHAFEMSIWFKDRMNWEAWSALDRGWKGDSEIVGELYQTWDY
jgi:hypothetical protein